MIHDFFHSRFSVCIFKWECVRIACLFESYRVWACERVNAWAILLYTSDLSGFWSHMINLYKYISHFLSGISQITSATCHVRKKMQNLQLNPPRAWPIKSGWNISLVRSKAVAIASCVSVLNLGIKCTCRDDSKEIFNYSFPCQSFVLCCRMFNI